MIERDAGTTKPLPLAYSVYLDAIRGVAALAVFTEHFRNVFYADFRDLKQPGTLCKLGYLATGLGHQSVIVFFVLSGFFVGSSVWRSLSVGRFSWSHYAVQRLTRLYIVLIPALVMGAVLDLLGVRFFGKNGIYAADPQYAAMVHSAVASAATVKNWLGTLFFLQGIHCKVYGSNGALWSLSYEFWYYILFPLLCLAGWFSKRRLARLGYFVLGVAVCYFVGRAITLYFVTWLMGAGVAALSIETRKRASSPILAIVAFIVFWLFVVNPRVHLPVISALPAVAQDFIIAAMFSYLAICITSSNAAYPTSPGAHMFGKVATGISATSYSLYLLHTPLLVFLNGMLIRGGSRWQPDPPSVARGALVAGLVLAYVWLLWTLTESKTVKVRKMIMGMLADNAPEWSKPEARLTTRDAR